MSLNEDTQPTTNNINSDDQCFFGNCHAVPSWRIISSVKLTNPDGSPLSLLSCDEHYSDLTSKLRITGTRYTLIPFAPTNKQIPLEQDSESLARQFREELKHMPAGLRILLSLLIIVVSIVIAPLMIIYYSYQWVTGWRPPYHDQ